MKNKDERLHEMSTEELNSCYKNLLRTTFTQWTIDQWKIANEYKRRANAEADRYRQWLTVRLGVKYTDIAREVDQDGRAVLHKAIPIAKVGADDESVRIALLRGDEPTQEVFRFERSSPLVVCLHEAITAPMGFPIPYRIDFLKLWLTPDDSSSGGSWPCGLFEWECAPENAIKSFKEKFPIHIAMGKTFVY